MADSIQFAGAYIGLEKGGGGGAYCNSSDMTDLAIYWVINIYSTSF